MDSLKPHISKTKNRHCYHGYQCLNFVAILPLLSQPGREAEAGGCACEHSTAVRLHLQKGKFLLVIISGTRLKFGNALFNVLKSEGESWEDSKQVKLAFFLKN